MIPKSSIASLYLLVLAGCATSGTDATRTAAQSPRADLTHGLLLISIDGLRPEFYRDAKWEAPTLRKLADLGVSFDAAEPIYPSLTYPSHTTIVTGVRSARHGIYSNQVFSDSQGPTAEWYWHTAHLKVPTLWQRAYDSGLKTAVLTWPVNVCGKLENSKERAGHCRATWSIPEIFASPDALQGETWGLMRERMDPTFADELVAANAGTVPTGFGPRDAWIARAAQYALQTRSTDFALIHFINLDFIEHQTGMGSPETREALRLVDQQLASVLSAIDLARTRVILLGDHGFYDYDRVLRPNVLFAQAGWKPSQVVAQGAGGSAAIYVRDPKLRAPVLALLAKNAPGHYRVLARRELDGLEAFPGALCALDPITREADGAPGLSFNDQLQGKWLEKLPKTRGNHGPLATREPTLMTGLIAAGPGIPAGMRLPRARLLDVAPTIARLLGLALPEAEGKPIAEISR